MSVERGSDQRLFPTMPKLREILAPYAWKWMGPSVSQSGDPVARHVLHISRRRRAAYLLMQPPAYGKSSIARSLFPAAAVPVVSGDLVIGRIAAGKLDAPPELVDAINEDYSPFQIDLAIQRIFERGLAPALIHMWIEQAGEGDFALDMYVPAQHQQSVRGLLVDAGFLPVSLEWERPGASLIPEKRIGAEGERFYMSMASQAMPEAQVRVAVTGFVDEALLKSGRLVLRGWAVDSSGSIPASVQVRVGNEIHVVDDFERQLRPDVQRHLELPHALVGYRLSVPVAHASSLEALRGRVEVQAGGEAFQIAAPLASTLRKDGQA